MRATWIVGLVLVASCGKELNPEYCTHNQTDPACQMPGVVQLDAAARCMTDNDCNGSVCDTTSGACVQCTATDKSHCAAPTSVCSPDDTCVQCNTGSDCASGGVCLPDNTCASSGTILYAAPGGSGDCSSAALACTLTKAVATATATPSKNVIQLQNGTFNEGTISLGVPNLQLVVAAGANVTITGSNNNKPLFNVTASASISLMTLNNSGGNGVDCSESATLSLDQLVISNSSNSGVNVNSCTVTLTRSKLFGNKESAIYTDGTTTVSVLNNFMYENGTSTDILDFGYTGGGAVSLNGKTTGQVRFNTIAFNNAADVPQFKGPPQAYPAGFSCGNQVSSSFNFSDNLLASDSPVEYVNNETCGNQSPTGANWIGVAEQVDFVSTSGDNVDLHLTANTPDPSQDEVKAIRDNADTNCTGVPNDYDNNLRPYNAACDYGADEFTPPMM